MPLTTQDYLVDEKGIRKAVVVPLADWEQILDALEELDDIRAYDEAKGRPSDPVPFGRAVEQLLAGAAG